MFEPQHDLISNKYGRNRWVVFSPKLHRKVQLYSELEYDIWVLLECNYQIESFCEKPLAFSHINKNGKHKRLFFEFWVKNLNGREYFISANSGDYESRRSKQIWCNDHNYEHILIDRDCFPARGNYLANMKRIVSFILQHGHPVDVDCAKVYRVIHGSPIKLDHLSRELSDLSSNRIMEALGWLVVTGRVCGDFEERLLGGETEVWRNAEASN